MTVNDDDALIGLRSLMMVAGGDPGDDNFEDVNDDHDEDYDDGTEDEEPAEIGEPPDDD
jgi:hypothetical protein